MNDELDEYGRGHGRIRFTDGRIIFVSGEGFESKPCKECGFESDYLCDYPVGNNKTCDALLCEKHAKEVGVNIHYCPGHYKEHQDFIESGGKVNYYENVYLIKK